MLSYLIIFSSFGRSLKEWWPYRVISHEVIHLKKHLSTSDILRHTSIDDNIKISQWFTRLEWGIVTLSCIKVHCHYRCKIMINISNRMIWHFKIIAYVILVVRDQSFSGDLPWFRDAYLRKQEKKKYLRNTSPAQIHGHNDACMRSHKDTIFPGVGEWGWSPPLH